MHIKTWHVELFTYEDDDSTSARAVLHTALPEHMEGHGQAIRASHDPVVPEIGEEVAAARALHSLADALLTTAAGDISEMEHRPVKLDIDGPTRTAGQVDASIAEVGQQPT